jgi:hypothetical protein
MLIHYVAKSANSKTGPIPVTYSERGTCPPSCGQWDSCYAEAGFHTRMTWNKVSIRGSALETVADKIRKLKPNTLWRFNVAGDLPGVGEDIDGGAIAQLVHANRGKRGFTYTHKHSARAIKFARFATERGFTVNLSADDAGHADKLAETGLPVAVVVPLDTPARTTTPHGRPIVVCPAQIKDDVTCYSCGLCQRANRKVIVGFLAHGTRAKKADAVARRVIPIKLAA